MIIFFYIGDSTVNILIKAYSKVLENKTDPRWRIEHSQIIDQNDLDGYNEKILPSVQPTTNLIFKKNGFSIAIGI